MITLLDKQDYIDPRARKDHVVDATFYPGKYTTRELPLMQDVGMGRNQDIHKLAAAQVERRILKVERGGSVVECRTRNRESPGSNPL